MDDPFICKNLVDHVPPSGYWASLHYLNDAEFLDRVNLNYAQHVCMVSELRLRYEHEISVREEFEKNFVDSSEVIQQRDAEIVKLKSKLGKVKHEVTGVVVVCKKVSELETAAASYKDAPLERIMASLYLEEFPSPKDETPDFRKLQPLLEQVTVLLYHEWGSCIPRIVCRELLLGISAPNATDVPPLNSIAVEDYTLSHVSMLEATAEFGLPNPSIITSFQISNIQCPRECVTAAVSELVRPSSEYFYHFIRSFPLGIKLSDFHCMACFIVVVDEISRTSSKGIPISTGITDLVSYVRENEATVFSLNLSVGLGMLDGCKSLFNV
uniref:Uncharacterized protein n=1 Tax=Tanacetum cinerariifolium TaxID=118510 RepID=A0A6L2KUQ1_TANCI|nr:hypothetical protein [Tanacetum cinerariifolium]